MSKVTLKFNLPEESFEHRMAINGHQYYIIIEETLERIRKKLKYESLPANVEQELEDIRDSIMADFEYLE